MGTEFTTHKQNQFQEADPVGSSQYPGIVRNAAKIISYIFHPVFVPVYVVLFMVYVHPYLFSGMSPRNKAITVLQAAMMFTFFPVVTVGLLKALDLINSAYLKTQKDRIIPLVACGVFYFWIAYIWWNGDKMGDSHFIPQEAVRFAMATFIASWLALMINVKMKISLHAISMGVMMAFIFLLAFSQDLNFRLWISVAFLTTGLVCTSRFIASDHKPAEIYGGLVAGAVSMLAGDFIGKIL